MSLDEQAELELYNAVNKVASLVWPKQRKRIFENTVKEIMRFEGWNKIELEKE